MRSKYLKVLVLLLFLVAVLLVLFISMKYYDLNEASATAESVRQSFVQKNKELEDKIRRTDNQLLQLEDKYYEDKLVKLVGKTKLLSLAKEQWQYSLTVNDTLFTEDHLYLTTKGVTIKFAEGQPKEKLLPDSIQEMGSLVYGDKLDKFYDHLIIDSSLEYERKIQTVDNSNGLISTFVYYTFNNVTLGSIITLRLSEPLKERLNLKYDTLEIIVNKIDNNN